jgi:HTH-type transcriptional regulator/antitoxin HigA
MIPGTVSEAYRNLMVDFLPRPIRDKGDYHITQREIDRLLDKEALSLAEETYLDLLGTLIMEYESNTEDRADYELHGVALIKGLLDLHDLKQKDLEPVFKTRSIVSAVLNGKRPLTADHINKLAAFFNLPHGLFFEPLETVY